MSDERMEERLRRAFRAQAGGIAPDEEASLGHIRHRARRIRTQRRVAATGICAVVLLVGVAVLGSLADGDTGVETTPPADRDDVTTTTAPRPTVTSTPPAPVPPPVAPPVAVVWPPPGHATYTEPVAAARSFMEEYIGFPDPTFGPISGEPDTSVELPVFSTGEDGSPLDDVASVILLRPVDGHWFVVSARSDEVVVEQPADFATISSPVVIDGRARGFEGTVVVQVRELGMGAGEFVSQEPTVAGCCETLEPFHLELIFGEPTAASGSLLLSTDSGLESAVSDFTVIPVLFRSGGGGNAVTEFDVFFVDADEEVVAVHRAVPRTTGVLRAALQALLAGPGPDGAEARLSSAFPDSAATVGFDVTITDGTAVVDFRARPFGEGGLGSAQSELLLRQLHRTVFQFTTVEQAEYRVGGSCEAFWNPLQRDCTTATRSDPGT